MADKPAVNFARLYEAIRHLYKLGKQRSHSQDLFNRKQYYRFWLGAAVGAVLETAVHSITEVLKAGSRQGRTGTGSWASSLITIASTYRSELLVFGICLLAIALPPIFRWLCRFTRSWWAGIASALPLSAALSVVALFNWGPLFPRSTVFSCAFVLLLTAGIEFLRHKPHSRTGSSAALKIPRSSRYAALEAAWNPRLGDEPITAWHEDIVGRASLVEVLATHILNLRTPILALDGGLGDGKTSVLNLLSAALDDGAIVVLFSAWLPGSETTFAIDLFRNIAAECGTYLHVPQLRKRTLAFARTVSGSVGYLAGFKEFFPAPSQRDEVLELHDSFARFPIPIVVLLDEIDRMQKDELLVLLKILRGASSFPNLTFVCAFSNERVKQELGKSSEDLEKFFPVSIKLAPPAPELVGSVFRSELQTRFRDLGWFGISESSEEFARLLEQVWHEGLSYLCTNLRKAGLLISDIDSAARPIVSEVNALDLTLVEALRRFCPSVYDELHTNPAMFVENDSRTLFSEEDGPGDYFKALDEQIRVTDKPEAIHAILSFLFPKYAKKKRGIAAIATNSWRPSNFDTAARAKRICVSDYFRVYFRAAVPEDMFSNTELEGIISDLNQSIDETQLNRVFEAALRNVAPATPRRADFVWKLSRAVNHLRPEAAEHFAYAAAQHATEYEYDEINVGEAASALNIVFAAAEMVSTTHAGRVLEVAVTRASHDTFAERMVALTDSKNRSHNDVLRNYSTVDLSKLNEDFILRMQERYGGAKSRSVDLSHADWQAFRRWVENSEQDSTQVPEFWRRFIGRDRRRLAQAVDFIFPGRNIIWSEDPRPLIERFFPLSELRALICNLPESPELNDIETKALGRMADLLRGRYRKGPNLWTEPDDAVSPEQVMKPQKPSAPSCT